MPYGRISENLGWAQRVRRSADDGYSAAIEDSATVVHLMDQTAPEGLASKYTLGETFGVRTYIDENDLERNLQRVRDARRMSYSNSRSFPGHSAPKLRSTARSAL